MILQNTFSQFLVEFSSNKEAFSIPGHFTCRQFFVSTTKHQTAGDRSSPAFVLSVALNTLSPLFSPDHSALPVAHKMLLHMCHSSVCLSVHTAVVQEWCSHQNAPKTMHCSSAAGWRGELEAQKAKIMG